MNLILLIGTNPLPNFVTAKYFKERIDTVHLIHSAENPQHPGTASAAKNLREQLMGAGICKIDPVALEDVASKIRIRQDLGAKLKILNGSSVHLNYTGGTKSMAVHIYTYLQETFKDRLTCSYLDAITGRIVFDDGSTPTEDLRQQIPVDINSMLGLHGYTCGMGRECSFPNALKILNEWVQNGKIAEFMAWKNHYLRFIFYRDTVRQFREEKVEGTKKHGHDLLNEHIKQEWIKQRVDECNTSLCKNGDIRSLIESFDDNPLFKNMSGAWELETMFDKSSFRGVKNIVYGFLDGIWLEHYIHGIIVELCEKKGLQGEFFGISLEPKRDGQTNNDLEMDAFIINGHVLNGISITTGNKFDCKLKAFEVMHRVRQIGGDESRGIVIGDISSKEAKTITETVKSELSGGEHDVHFKALGREAWKRDTLIKELETFIWQRQTRQ